MQAHEPQLRSRSQRRYSLEIGCLLLAPGEIEARGKFEQIGPVSIEEIGDCAPADVAEEAQWTPNPLHFETTAVAEREEGDMIPQHVIGKNYGAAGSACVTNKSDAMCCVKTWHHTLQGAGQLSGSQCGGADAWYVNEPIVQHKHVTVFHVCRYSAAAGY